MTAWPSQEGEASRPPLGKTKQEWAQFYKDQSARLRGEQELSSHYNDWNVTQDRPPRPFVQGTGDLFGDGSEDDLHTVWELREFGSDAIEWNSAVDGVAYTYTDEVQHDANPWSEPETCRDGTSLDTADPGFGTAVEDLVPESLEERIERLAPRIWRLGRSLAWQNGLHATYGEDLGQEGVLRVIEKAGEYAGGAASFGTFAFVVSRRAMFNTLRGWKRMRLRDERFAATNRAKAVSDDPCFAAARDAELQAMLDSHPDGPLLRLVEEVDDDHQLALELGVSYEVARKRRLRAAKRFMEALEA